MAMESRIRLLPIPCCSRQHRPVVHLQASPPSTMAKRSGSPQSNREKEVGEIYASLRQMDPKAPHPASLSRGSLLRHSSFVRAVCVDALARISAGAACEGRPYRDRVDFRCEVRPIAFVDPGVFSFLIRPDLPERDFGTTMISFREVRRSEERRAGK